MFLGICFLKFYARPELLPKNGMRHKVVRSRNFKTRIFLDSGDPEETKEATKLLGFLDGQTTNPTLISKNPDAAARLARGEKFTGAEILDFYKKTVREISGLIPDGSVSIEVYADPSTLGIPTSSSIPPHHLGREEKKKPSL